MTNIDLTNVVLPILCIIIAVLVFWIVCLYQSIESISKITLHLAALVDEYRERQAEGEKERNREAIKEQRP